MRVWIVSVGEPLPSDTGEVRLRRMGLLSEIMAKQGDEVHWFSTSFDHYKKIQRCTVDTHVKINNNLTIHLIKANGYKRNVSLARIIHHFITAKGFLKMTNKLQEPDIILCSMEPLEMSSASVRYAVKNNKPVIVDVRDLWPDIFQEVLPGYARPFVKPYVLWCRKKLKETLSKATSIIGVTPKFLDYGLKYAGRDGKSDDKVFYISYKPQDVSNQYESFNSIWSDYNISRNDFIITFLGNFGKQFEINPIIEAAKKLSGRNKIKFVLCGTGENLPMMKEKAKKLPNVIFPGWIEKKHISTLLAVSKLGLAPYRDSINFSYNVPNKFGEYLSVGLPVILGIGGVMKELITENMCGVCYSNSDELVDIILSLYNNENNLKIMSQNAYRLYESKFNSNKVYNEMAEYLREIARVN